MINVIDQKSNRLPVWFRQDIPDIKQMKQMKDSFRQGNLHTVCESAKCPNIGQCWKRGVATFMILGNVCTRACRFCAVKSGKPVEVDLAEPRKVAKAVKELDLDYVVITSVTRDDLADEGVSQFIKTIYALRALTPKTKIEVLIPDFSNRLELLDRLVSAKPDVINHNMETVQRLSSNVRPQAEYERSLDVLANLRNLADDIFIKTGFMVGMGESQEEVVALMEDISDTGCDMLTIGQYLAPTKLKRHFPVNRFVTPEEFELYRLWGQELGFKYVESGPLVRSSYLADRGYKEMVL